MSRTPFVRSRDTLPIPRLEETIADECDHPIASRQQSSAGRRTIPNTKAPIVRQRLRGSPPRTADRRVRRTRHALSTALIELVLQKRYDAITIQDLLDRAGVGRSTFYAHYRGKDDLLFRSFEGLLDLLDRAMERDDPQRFRVAPVRELFHHVGGFRSFHRRLAQARRLDLVYGVGVGHVSKSIARRLSLRPSSAGTAAPLPVVAQALAGTLFAMLRWWVDHDAPYSPERMDELYHALVLRGVEQVWPMDD